MARGSFRRLQTDAWGSLLSLNNHRFKSSNQIFSSEVYLAISNQFSAFVPLQSANASAAKPDGSSYVNYLAPVARVVVIEGEPLLLASLSTNLSRELTLYGRLGRSYQLQSATSLASPIIWTPQWDYVQTNGTITINVDSAPPMLFYRIFQPFQP